MEENSKKFDEFEAGTAIYLNVRAYFEAEKTKEISVRELSLKSFILDEGKVHEKLKDSLPAGFRLCSDIKVDGYLITFDELKNTYIDMIISVGYNNYRFRRVRVKSIDVGNKKYLLVGTKDRGVKFNLRKAFRVRLDSYARVAFLPAMVQKECHIKDLSSTGIGIEVDASYEVEIGAELEIQFSFENKEIFGILTLYTIRAKVLRKISYGEEKNYLGCVIIKKDNSIDKLVMLKQRDEVRKLIK